MRILIFLTLLLAIGAGCDKESTANEEELAIKDYLEKKIAHYEILSFKVVLDPTNMIILHYEKSEDLGFDLIPEGNGLRVLVTKSNSGSEDDKFYKYADIAYASKRILDKGHEIHLRIKQSHYPD